MAVPVEERTMYQAAFWYVASTESELPMTDVAVGSPAVIIDGMKLKLWNGSEWIAPSIL